MPNRDEILTIHQLTEYIKANLEGDPLLQKVTVRGEISNFYRHRSGHLYFTLKDQDSQIRCVMFRSSASYVKFEIENGMNLIATGSIGVYQARGEYQLYVQRLEPDGIGALHLAFEQLKKKLDAEGLFDTEIKKQIPRLPRRIGVITSPTGAAVRDIISVITRRFPFVEILLAPAQVQGVDAPASLVQALEILQGEELDVIIIGRGGGSIEDLWAFNEEIVARAIFATPIPVISAVGHETDFTIADFVADLRAPTPSAAAELAVANYGELVKYVNGIQRRLQQCVVSQFEKAQERLARIEKSRIFVKPEEVFLKPWQEVDDLERRLHRTMDHQLQLAKEQFKGCLRQMESLSPLKVLSRGYSLTETVDGQLIKRMEDVKDGGKVKIRLLDGQLLATVEEKKENEL